MSNPSHLIAAPTSAGRWRRALSAAAIGGLTILAGCDSVGAVSGGAADSTAGLINDGTVQTRIVEGTQTVPGNFICSQSASGDAPTVVVGTNGLVGGLLTDLLNSLGLGVVTSLINSVSNPPFAVDGNLDNFAGVTLTAGLLGPVITSVDTTVVLPTRSTMQPGKYAVFAVSFPSTLVNLSVFNRITVSTYLENVLQETQTLNQTGLGLLGVGVGLSSAFIGVRTTLPFNSATLSVVPGVLTANVINAVRIHDFCIDGRFVGG